MQFVDAEVDIHLSLFMKQMLYLLLLSGVLAVVVMGCVVYLLVTIRRKNRLFRQREASVNGTVHDLKAPLNSIVALMGLLKRHVTAETDRALIEKTSAQARSLVGEIEELLITARRDRQRLYIQKKEVDLLALIRTACASVEARSEAKPHHICIEAETESVSLYADGLYVTNVIRNLIENALKYSDDGVEDPDCSVSGEGFAELVVEDTGWGIDRRYQKKVFTQFFQVPHREEAARRGYGVGLAYVNVGWRHPEEASVWRVRPAREAALCATFLVEIIDNEVTKRNKMKILFIDDDLLLGQIIATALAEEGYEVCYQNSLTAMVAVAGR